MVAFEIYINGRKRFTAGGEEYQSLFASLALIRLPLPKPDDVCITLSASAVSPYEGRAGSWPILNVAVGDRIEIRVVDVATTDAPKSVQTSRKVEKMMPPEKQAV
jgi:hypothetical protein